MKAVKEEASEKPVAEHTAPTLVVPEDAQTPTAAESRMPWRKKLWIQRKRQRLLLQKLTAANPLQTKIPTISAAKNLTKTRFLNKEEVGSTQTSNLFFAYIKSFEPCSGKNSDSRLFLVTALRL